MKKHKIRVSPSEEKLAKTDQLAWKLATLASDNAPIDSDALEMLKNRIIDNAAVAIAAINREPVANARTQALAHPRENGATLYGLTTSTRVDAEWAAWANAVAVRELDMHDTFLAADYSHPADSIPAILAVAEQCKKTGTDLIRGALVAYEIHIALVKSICLHKYKKDHIAHLCPAQAAGIGALLGLDTETIYQAIQQAVHVSFTTRQSRKGEISSWKAYAPAHAAKLAIEAVDRAMRGEKSPSPIYEGEDSVIAYMLGGSKDEYEIELPEKGEVKRAILESYTKEHSAEYQSQALIDLAFSMRKKIADFSLIKKITIHTSHHTHFVIGTGSGDPQKLDPKASRETLDHSIMYIFAVALEDGTWHHVDSYTAERASRKETVKLWQKIETREDKEWTARYHDPDPKRKAFGGKVEIEFQDGKKLIDELAVADAHVAGRRAFGKKEYIAKFQTLTDGLIEPSESSRFVKLVERLEELNANDLLALHPVLDASSVIKNSRDKRGIF